MHYSKKELIKDISPYIQLPQYQRYREMSIDDMLLDNRIVFMVDARTGLTAQDQFVARELRRAGKPVTLAVNKGEGLDPEVTAADFHALGFGAPRVIAASHGSGCRELIDDVLAGMQMFLKGKLGLIPSRIKGTKEVKSLFKK